MPKIINIYRVDRTNVGDMYSTPTRYIPWLKDADFFDLYNDDFKADVIHKQLHGSSVIVGGGGLLGTQGEFYKNILEILAAKPKKLIFWGAGHNHFGEDNINEPDYLAEADLVGIRDWGTRYEWVPCTSCLHSAFEKRRKVKRPFVGYFHKDYPFEITGMPIFSNEQAGIEEVLDFIGSGEVILTNSYHGAYWGTLLNRRVIIINPFSSKFRGYKHQPPIADHTNWKKFLSLAINYPQALSESRQANIAFAEKVKQYLF